MTNRGAIMAEYAVLATTGELKVGMADASANEVSQSVTVVLNQIVQKAAKGMEKLQGGGWDIVSHEVTRIDRHLVVSFLLRR